MVIALAIAFGGGSLFHGQQPIGESGLVKLAYAADGSCGEAIGTMVCYKMSENYGWVAKVFIKSGYMVRTVGKNASGTEAYIYYQKR